MQVLEEGWLNKETQRCAGLGSLTVGSEESHGWLHLREHRE